MTPQETATGAIDWEAIGKEFGRRDSFRDYVCFRSWARPDLLIDAAREDFGVTAERLGFIGDEAQWLTFWTAYRVEYVRGATEWFEEQYEAVTWAPPQFSAEGGRDDDGHRTLVLADAAACAHGFGVP